MCPHLVNDNISSLLWILFVYLLVYEQDQNNMTHTLTTKYASFHLHRKDSMRIKPV